MNGIHPAAVCCLEHAQIIRNAEFLVFRNSHKIKGGILRCKKHAVGTGFDHSLCHFAGGLGDYFQRMVYGIATLPEVGEAQLMTGKCLMGGLKRTDITQRDHNAISHQIYECLVRLGGRNQILTPGCVIRYPLDNETLCYIKKAKDALEEKMKAAGRL